MLLYVSIFQLLPALVVYCIRLEYADDTQVIVKRALQKSHEKPRLQKLSEFFLPKDFYSDDPDLSLINLLNEISGRYLSDCTTVILYDSYTETKDRVLLTKFFQQYRVTSVHGSIPKDYHMQIGELVNQKDKNCFHFIIFINDVMRCQDVVNKANEKVVVVTKSSQWRVHEYLSSEYSQEIANLLIIVKSEKFMQQKQEAPYILYTHKLFVDALGSSKPQVLTSWSEGNFSRNITLFQTKLNEGFAGHRFIVTVAHQPPYVIKQFGSEELKYDGIEIRLLNLLSKMFNFTTDYKESPDIRTLGSGEAVIKAVRRGNINLGAGGLFITGDRYNVAMFHWHSEDCAAFISLASTALPRYRAIMGPFRWTVWMALIMVYLGAIFLFSYSDKATLKHLIKNPEEIENMFWYVFGTFTNCFTFTGRRSWTKAKRGTTKLLVGIYWLFTIIITACYTGSIIAFVTLPVFPAVVDTTEQLVDNRYQIGMLDRGGWPGWFKNVSDKTSRKLLEDVDYVPNIESGLKNVTKAFFWPYALLGSREELTFTVKTNFSLQGKGKRSLLHITEQCFVPFKVGIIMPSHSVYSEVLAEGIQQILQSGLLKKIKNDVEWDLLRSASGKLLAANSRIGGLKTLRREDRALTLEDTQGMFLLLGIGFIAGGSALASEVFGGCFNLCKKSKPSRTVSSNSSIPSNPRFHERQTNRERTHSMALELHQEKQRSLSLKSTEIAPDNKPNIEEQFGETLVHYDEISSSNTSAKFAAECEPSCSHVDYNEEITAIFNQALENEDYECTKDQKMKKRATPKGKK